MSANQKPTPAQINMLEDLERRAGLRASCATELRALVQLRGRGWADNDNDGYWDITREGRAVIAASKAPCAAAPMVALVDDVGGGP